MKNMTEDDIRRNVDMYSEKSEDELLSELSGFNIGESEFDDFMNMMLPMLNDEQKAKLLSIKNELMKGH